MEAGKRVKQEGLDNNLLELIAESDAFDLSLEELQSYMEPINYVGRSVEQVETFIKEVIKPVLDDNSSLLGMDAVINV